MEPLSSPERPSVKVTYMGRQKKRKIADVADAITTQTTSSVGRTESMRPPSKGPASMGPKKIDVHLPGPAPKRIRHDSEDTDVTKTSDAAKKPPHHRSSSISSLAHIVQKVAASSPASAKPLSARAKKSLSAKPSSAKRTATPETEMDDNASIADSVMSVGVGKIRRTETERIEYFRNQPECSTLEAHRALCTRCEKFVNLGRKQTYAVRPWEAHRSKCDQQVPNPHVKGSHSHSEEGDDEGDDTSTIGPSNSRRAPRKTVAERKAILEADSRVANIKPDEVQCRKCEKWIRLSTKMEYVLGNWNKHALLCCDAVPSSRVATATRKLHLVNDSQAKSFGVYNVRCASCDCDVDLGQEIDYDLTKWKEHKAQCHFTPPETPLDSKPGATNTDSVQSVRPTSASEEDTLVASSPLGSSPLAPGVKRMRDESDLPVDDSDVRPSNRSRSEAYVPPEKEAPGPMGWFLLPFKAFVQGFRESLKAS